MHGWARVGVSLASWGESDELAGGGLRGARHAAAALVWQHAHTQPIPSTRTHTSHTRAHTHFPLPSFAMHLLDGSRLHATLAALAAAARWLVLLSPHKRPPVKPGSGWRLEAERTVERVHARVYESDRFSSIGY